MRESQTEVLIVGAGPVGLWTGLLLAEAGLQVAVVDREERPTTRTYACALHPSTLRLFHERGLAEAVIAQSRKADTVAFYDAGNRCAEVSLRTLDGDFPFLAILPQSSLESALAQRAREKGVSIYWRHRLDALTEENELVTATVEELENTATGYIVPHSEVVVKSRFQVRAQILVGADGQNSLVRQRLGLQSDRTGSTDFFAAYEFESDEKCPDEVRVVMDRSTTNVLWPLSENRGRWTFQITASEQDREFPEKERRAVRLLNANVDDRLRKYVQRVSGERAPWFKAGIKDVTWCTQVSFQHRVVNHFGRQRCWLVGDAAHQTGPVGVQSMNVGFQEAARLATLISSVVRDSKSPELLQAYDRQQSQEWRTLLGLSGGLKPRKDTDDWVREHASRLLPCLPGSNSDLRLLTNQLKLDFE